MLDALVKGDQHAALLHRQAKQISIRDLLVAKDAACEGAREVGPRLLHWPVAIARCGSKVCEKSRSPGSRCVHQDIPG